MTSLSSTQLGNSGSEFEVVYCPSKIDLMALHGNGTKKNNPELQEDTKRVVEETDKMMLQILSSQSLKRISPIALLKPEEAKGAEDAILREMGNVVEKVPTCSSIVLAPVVEDKNEKNQDEGFGDGFKFYNMESFYADAYNLHSDSEDEGLSDSDADVTDVHSHFDFDWYQYENIDLFDDTVVLDTVLHRAEDHENETDDYIDDGFGDGFKFYDMAYYSGDADLNSEYSKDELLEDEGFGDGFKFYDFQADAVDAVDDDFDWFQPEDHVIYLFDGDVAILDHIPHFNWDAPDEDVYLFDGDVAFL